jgi:predicted house-cleaning noncanonical NTP pyrophosphatase (MazG superfamily)
MVDPEETPKEDSFEALKDYFELLAHILPLGNWRVALEGSNSHDMSHYVATPDAYGACQKNRNMQYAEVFINLDKPQKDEYGETWEHTLIHEMLHVVTDEISEYVECKYPELLDDILYCSKMERLINMLSYAIYDALALERSMECSCGNSECTCQESVSKVDLTGDNGTTKNIYA